MPCRAVTKRGNPCKAQPWKGTEYCSAHQDREAQQIVGFGGAQPGAGRPPKPRAVDVLKERIEDDVDQVLAPLFDALTAKRAVVVGNGPTAHMEMVPDDSTRIVAARELLDRGYGRPKQATEHSGPDGQPIAAMVGVADLSKLNADELRDLRRLLAKSHGPVD